jgi:hypothetical protein
MKFLSHIDLAGVSRILNAPVPVGANDVVTKGYVESEIEKALLGFDFQADVKAVQADDTLVITDPQEGDRYIITNIPAIHSSFGVIADIGAGDIVQYNGSAFEVVYDVSTKDDGIMVFNQGDNNYYKFVEGNWSYGGFSSVTAGLGLDDVGGTFNVLYDDSTFGLNGDGGLELLDASITKAKLGNDIAGLGLKQEADGSLALKIGDARLTADVDGIKLVETYTKKVVVPVGDGNETSITVNHGLGTREVTVQIVDAVSYDTVDANVSRPDENNVVVSFAVAPNSGQYKAIIIG